jgi:hypothetical protein
MRLNHLLKTTMFMMAADPKSGGAGGADDGDDEKLAQAVAAAVAAALPKALNGAITAHLKRLESKIDERIKPLEAKGQGGDDDQGNDGEATGGAGGAPAKPGKGQPDPELVALKKRLEQTEKRLADEKAARDKAVAETRTREERGTLQEALVAAGVSKDMVGAAVAYLYGDQKKVRRVSEEGKDDRLVWAGDDDAELAIADGVKAWVATPTGRGFMPPRDGVGGSGGGGGKRPGGPTGGPPPDTSDKAIIDLILG